MHFYENLNEKSKNAKKPENVPGLVMTGHQVIENNKKPFGGKKSEVDPNQSFNSEGSKHHTVHVVPTFNNM